MPLFYVIAFVVTLAAVFSYFNARFLKLPNVIGVMAVALGATLLLLPLTWTGVNLQPIARSVVGSIDLEQLLLHGMLAFLLFAGSLKVDIGDLSREWLPVFVLSTLGTAISTAVVGGLSFVMFTLLGMQQVSLLACFLFGALISPTDPLAVARVLKRFGAPKALETQSAGESLFNSGAGVVLFVLLLEFARSSVDHAAITMAATPWAQVWLGVRRFLVEVGGGMLVGLGTGFLCILLLWSVKGYRAQVLITLALVAIGWVAAKFLHTSGPIAMVFAGLLIGNQWRRFAVPETTRQHLAGFWEMMYGILNAVFFALMGLEAVLIPSNWRLWLAVGSAIVIALLARLVSVGLLISPMAWFRNFAPGSVQILTWAGMRGGISIALALSLPAGMFSERNEILAVTYGVVVFSILVQGLTAGQVVRRFNPKIEAAPSSGNGTSVASSVRTE